MVANFSPSFRPIHGVMTLFVVTPFDGEDAKPLSPSFNKKAATCHHAPPSPRYLERFLFCGGGQFSGRHRGDLVPKVRRWPTKAADWDRNYPPTFKVESLGSEAGQAFGRFSPNTLPMPSFCMMQAAMPNHSSKRFPRWPHYWGSEFFSRDF